MSRLSFRWAGILVLAVVLTALSSATVLAQDSQPDENSGALVVAVIAGSPAADAHVVRGDIILAMGDQPVVGNADLRALIQEATPGDVVPFTIRHGDNEYVVDVELGEVDGRPYLGVYLARDLELPMLEEGMTEAQGSEEADSGEAEMTAEPTEEATSEPASTDEVAPAEETPTAEAVVPEGQTSEGSEAEAMAPATEESEAESAVEAEVSSAEEEVAEPAATEAEAGEADATVQEGTEAAGAEAEAAETEEPEMDEGAASEAPRVFGMQPYTDTAGGAMVIAIADGGPAADAGINRGDVILGADGERFQQVDDLVTFVDSHEPGDEVTLQILRRTGDLEDVAVTLGAHPDDEEQAYLGIGFMPTPRRMFLGHSRDGDLLVPPMPFWAPRDGEDMPDWWPQGPHHDWMPRGFPFGQDGSSSDDNSDDLQKDSAPAVENNGNA
jgi:PDZ domain-containing secreted protein